MKYFKLFDKFGGKESEFKTHIGGMTTLFVYSLAMFYLILQMYYWFNYQLLPMSQASYELLDHTAHKFTDKQIILRTHNLHNHSNLNPFNKSAMILVPEIVSEKNQHTEIEFIDATEIRFKNIELNNTNQKVIRFTVCNPEHEQKYNYICASQNETNRFHSYLHQLSLVIKQHEYDIINGQLKQYEKQYSITIDPELSQIQLIEFTTGLTKVDKGRLYPSYEYHTYISDSKNTIQSVSDKYIFKAIKQKAQLILILRLEKLQQQILIQYPSIGTVLANVGSIVQILMMAQIFIRIINSISLENFLIDQIIGYYYPEFKDIQIKRSIFGSNQFISKKAKLQYEPLQIGQIYKRAAKIAIQKLSILNIIYELSRIQFILQSLQERNTIIQARDVGIKLPLKSRDDKKQIKSTNLNSNRLRETKQILNTLQILDLGTNYQVEQIQIEQQTKLEQNEIQLKYSDMELFIVNKEIQDQEENISSQPISKLLFYEMNKIKLNEQT